MLTRIEFRPEVEDLVRFVEETDPDDIVEKTIAKLRNGVTNHELLTANTLAVVRSNDVPPSHHGGPVHPICGVHAIHGIAERLPGELSMLPLIQHTALCNHHVHSPYMGPYLMPKIEALQASPEEVEPGIRPHNVTSRVNIPSPDEPNAISDTQKAFLHCIRAMEAPLGERYYLWLLDRLSHGEMLDLLLPLAVSRNNWDDHYFLYPVYTFRTLDCLGWEWADVLLRPAVRYQARLMGRLTIGDPLDFVWVESLLDKYKLLEINIPTRTSDAETERIGELGMQLGQCEDYFDTIEPMAQALAGGLSLEGAGEALSIGAAAAYLSTSYGNPMDSHLHTGSTNRRYVLRQEGVSLRNKILSLLTGFTGPEVLLGARKIDWTCNIEPGSTASLPERSQEHLLDAITDNIDSQPYIDWHQINSVANVVPPEGIKEGVAMARQYAEKGYDPVPYFNRLAEISCRDDFTEMHSVKHFQAIVDEYYATREPYRWLHLASATKSAGIIQTGREHSVYRQSKEILKAA